MIIESKYQNMKKFRNWVKISSSSVLRLTHGIFRQISNVTILEMIRGDWLKAQWCQIAWLLQSGVTENYFRPKSIEKLRGIKNSAKPQIALHGLVIQLRRVCAKSWVFSQEGPRTPLWSKLYSNQLAWCKYHSSSNFFLIWTKWVNPDNPK